MPSTDPGVEGVGGPDRAPRSFVRRLVGMVVGLLAFVGALVGLLVLFSRLPSNTGSGSLVIRGVVAGLVGIVLILVVRRMAGSMAAPPPPPPQTVDARTSEVVYVCPVCGTRVRLELAATTKAPKHCGEEMEAQLARY